MSLALNSALLGARLAQAHSPGPGLAASAPWLAHLNGVDPEVVVRGP